MMYKISTGRIPEIFALLKDDRKLYVPEVIGNKTNFAVWQDDKKHSFDKKTSSSLKEFFFPQSEKLVEFNKKGKSISIVESDKKAEPFVVFGAHPCDVKAVEILDRVFLSEPCDSFYKQRRDSGTIVAVACKAAEETCFCAAFGIDASEPSGDVAVWITEDVLYWEARTDKGEELTKIVSGLFEKAGEAEEETLKEYKEDISNVIRNMPLSGLKPKDVDGSLQELFCEPVWEDLSRVCLGCGACTFICPTCQCYDISDYDTGHDIKRSRCWDSCMYKDFTLMAHGNPRTSQLERFRQRFMHKLVYFPENNEGEFSCVGCGRCVSKCPVSLNIAKVIKALGGRKNVCQ